MKINRSKNSGVGARLPKDVGIFERNIQTAVLTCTSAGLAFDEALLENFDTFHLAQTSASTDKILLPDELAIGDRICFYADSAVSVGSEASSGVGLNGEADTVVVAIPAGGRMVCEKVSATNILAEVIDSAAAEVSEVGVGTAGTNVVATTVGSKSYVTTLALSAVSYTIAGAANEAVGALIFTLPAGAQFVEACYMSVALQGGGTVDADTPDIGVGTVIATGAVAVLGGTATFEDILDGQTATDADGTATVALLAPDDTLSVAGDVKAVHLNIADGWAGADTVTATGTIVLKWTQMS